MTAAELETWVLSIVRRVHDGQRVEDAKVELKASWVDPPKAARQLAGHANAARSPHVLWVIGLDEEVGPVGAVATEVSNWYAQLRSHFDAPAPSLTMNLDIVTGTTSVVGLLFDAQRVPYVVKNPAFGQQGGGPVAFEVPWREGAAVRTARRSELIKLLTPFIHLPEIEVRRASLGVREWSGENQIRGWVEMNLYIVPQPETIVIPFHRCDGLVEVAPGRSYPIRGISIHPPSQLIGSRVGSMTNNSLTIESTRDEVIIHGPGRVTLHASFFVRDLPRELLPEARLSLQLQPIHAARPATIDLLLGLETQTPESALWLWRESIE